MNQSTDTQLAEMAEAFAPFLNLRDQFPQSGKLISKAMDDLTPVTVTVTKGQFLAALGAVAKATQP